MPAFEFLNYYDLLGVSPDTDSTTMVELLKGVFVEMLRDANPEFYPEDSPERIAAEKKITQIEQAIRIFKRPEARSVYDFLRKEVAKNPSLLLDIELQGRLANFHRVVNENARLEPPPRRLTNTDHMRAVTDEILGRSILEGTRSNKQEVGDNFISGLWREPANTKVHSFRSRFTGLVERIWRLSKGEGNKQKQREGFPRNSRERR